MSRYKKGTKKPPVIVEVASNRAEERPLPPELVRTYHPRKGWIITEVKK